MPRIRVVPIALLLALACVLQAAAQDARPPWMAGGEVRYEARDALSAWSGVAEIAELVVALDPGDVRSLRLAAVVHPASFSSGNFLRDRQARREVFEVDVHPEARITAHAAADTPSRPLPSGGSASLLLDAEVTLHGVTRPYRIEAILRRDGAPSAGAADRVEAEASFVVSLTAHGMRRPALFGLVSDDAVRVSVTAWGHPDPAPTPTTP